MAKFVHPFPIRCAGFSLFHGGNASCTEIAGVLNVHASHVAYWARNDEQVKELYERVGLREMFDTYVTKEMLSKLPDYRYRNWANNNLQR